MEHLIIPGFTGELPPTISSTFFIEADEVEAFDSHSVLGSWGHVEQRDETLVASIAVEVECKKCATGVLTFLADETIKEVGGKRKIDQYTIDRDGVVTVETSHRDADRQKGYSRSALTVFAFVFLSVGYFLRFTRNVY